MMATTLTDHPVFEVQPEQLTATIEITDIEIIDDQRERITLGISGTAVTTYVTIETRDLVVLAEDLRTELAQVVHDVIDARQDHIAMERRP